MRDSDTIILENIYKDILSEQFDWDSLKYNYSEDMDSHRLDFFNNSGAVGHISWDKDDGELDSIYVGDKMRRLGIGTHMWDVATELSEEKGYELPQHSSKRSKSGEGFAQSIGGHIPSLTDDVDGWSS